MIDRHCLISPPYRQLTAPQLLSNAASIYCAVVCTAVQFASKLCSLTARLYYHLPGLIGGQVCPVFQTTSGHPAKPLPIRASGKGLQWSSGHPGPAQANLRQKLGSTHCLALTVQSPLSGSSAECKKLSLNIKMHSLQCFLVCYNCSHLCCHFADHLLCASWQCSAFQKCLQVDCWSKVALLATSLAISSTENTQL